MTKYGIKKVEPPRQEFILRMPCFSCEYAYNCKYYQNQFWDCWIIKNDECPVNKYPFDALYYADKNNFII